MTRPQLLLCASAAMIMSSCHVLGLQADACEVGDDTTCPSGQFCDGAACVKGSDPATTPVDVVTGESGPGPVVVDKNGDVFWATNAKPGCIRTLAGAKAATFACEAVDKIGAITVDDNDVYWTVDAAGPDGAVRAQSRASGAQAQTLANGMTMTPQSAGFHSLDVAHHPDGTTSILFSRRDSDTRASRLLLKADRTLQYQADYGDPFPDTVDDTSVALVLANDSAAFVGCRFDDGTAELADRILSEDDPDGGAGGLDQVVNMTAVHKPQGTVSALVPLDAAAASIAVATTASDGGGALIKMGTNVFAPALLAARADPENPLTHASALATDGFFVYYTTAGTPSPGKKRGLFKLDFLTAGAKPVRILDLDVDGGGVAFDAKTARILWAEPAKNRIRSVAAPHASS